MAKPTKDTSDKTLKKSDAPAAGAKGAAKGAPAPAAKPAAPPAKKK